VVADTKPEGLGFSKDEKKRRAAAAKELVAERALRTLIRRKQRPMCTYSDMTEEYTAACKVVSDLFTKLKHDQAWCIASTHTTTHVSFSRVELQCVEGIT
jgi:hypothetical protein